MDVKVASNCSYVWRSIMWGRELLREGLRWKVGDGRNIRIFKDAWLENLPGGKVIQERASFESYRVADVFHENLTWDVEELERLMLPVEIEEVLKLSVPAAGSKDHRYWKFDTRGNYTVKSGYLVATNYFSSPESSSEDNNSKWWKFVWSFDLPQRVRIFVWRVFRNIVPMEMNLHKHHVPVFGRCGWCRKGRGTTSHFLIFCEKVRMKLVSFEFWKILKKWEGRDIREIGEALRNKTSRSCFEKWLMGMWLIWKGLCEEKHRSIRLQCCDLERECEMLIEGYYVARQQAAMQSRLLPAEGSARWIPPSRGKFRLDVDYAVDEENGKAGVGAIVRDARSGIIFAMAKPIRKSASVLFGELKALMHGICQCIEDNLSPVEAYSDSMLAVTAVVEGKNFDSVLGEDLADFFIAAKELNVLSVGHVRREANRAAHELASLAKSINSTSV